MKPARRALLVLLLFTIPQAPVAAAAGESGALSEAERREMIELLESSGRRFLELVEGVSDEQWSWKPAPDRWSVGECAEHILLSERSLFETALAALEQAPDPDWAEKTAGKAELLARVMPDRNPGGAGGAQAPQEVRPRHGLGRDEVVSRFRDSRREILAFVEGLDRPLKRHVIEHPFPIFGPLNAYDWLIYVPLHTVRHSKQIVEVQETPGYPD